MSNGLEIGLHSRVDGGIRSGWDVIVAALLGADGYGFGSIALVAEGCLMANLPYKQFPVGITSGKRNVTQEISRHTGTTGGVLFAYSRGSSSYASRSGLSISDRNSRARGPFGCA